MCYYYVCIAKPPFTKPPFVNSRVRGALGVERQVRVAEEDVSLARNQRSSPQMWVTGPPGPGIFSGWAMSAGLPVTTRRQIHSERRGGDTK